MNDKIPGLYETENIDTANRIIHRRYDCNPSSLSHFYWLIAELDPERNLAFGYANLADDHMAESGYIDVGELLGAGADMDRSWKPCTYEEARHRIVKEKVKDWNDGMTRFKRWYFGKERQPKLDDFR